jgi:hypothetical protein
MSSQLSSEPVVDWTKLEVRPAGVALEEVEGPACELDGPALDEAPSALDEEGPFSAAEEPKSAKKPQRHQRELGCKE